MADVDVEAEAQAAAKPARKRAVKAKAGGAIGAVVGWVIALAAIIMCVFLFQQVQTLNAKLGAADIPQPAGAPAADGQGVVAGEQGYELFDWQDNPQEVYYELGELQANTVDGRLLVGNITLVLESGPTTAERLDYEKRIETYKVELQIYFEDLEEYNDYFKQQVSLLGPGRWVAWPDRGAPQLVLAGFAAAHTAPAAPPEVPVMPTEPTPPRTILEKVLDEQATALRSNVVDLINARTGNDLITVEGKAEFKQAIIDKINDEMIDPHYGLVKGVELYPWLVVKGA